MGQAQGVLQMRGEVRKHPQSQPQLSQQQRPLQSSRTMGVVLAGQPTKLGMNST